MNAARQRERELDTVELQALAWVRHMAAGAMTPADGAALRHWCQADPAHRAAFVLARQRWQQLGEAARLAAARNPASLHLAKPARAPDWRRRALLGGAMSLGAAAATAAVIHPPLGLWPSVGEMRADYRTATGERRLLALADDVTVEMNTRTSIAVRTEAGRVQGIDLIAGEAAVDTIDAPRAFAVVAGAGRASALSARFEVKCTAAGVRVTCIDGTVQVAHTAGTVTLAGRQQLSYDQDTLGPLVRLDAIPPSGWRDGYLRFADTPLREVVDEINRYRPGRVVLLNQRIAERHVTGRFQIHSLDKAIVQIQRSLGLEARTLPGGIVLLG
ncbi:hypothetical protein BKK79_02260 [Cupriavidus sp. USMAA2-4]|uniref:FecR family protein n=1 Tax=Cupriavidus sp. USMAA2-4 TaxID=876364 RepID=UPI0008A6711A|nr:FecR domain-containing protein [Cupriavidus sp. USMAA2-4]AOY90769.1 hypothetical protein BKK79_02260 [Cupriavidus sp. USMAA2-4]